MTNPKAPAVTVLIVSHNKPRLLPEAVASVLEQTWTDWRAILIDSGVLYDQGYFAEAIWASDPRLRVVPSGETAYLRRRKAMAPWCFNECFRRGWVDGELVMYLCDDDILYPDALATFTEAFRRQPGAMAMYAAQDMANIWPDGRHALVGERRAVSSGGKCCAGRIMDCQVDYLQLCHRRGALDAFPTTEYWPEDKATGDHADGIFMEKLGSFWEILPLDIKVGENRRTPWSVNLPVAADEAAMPPAAPVHETVMDAWTMVRRHLDASPKSAELQKALADFQGQLRKLCEQDHAQRRRLVSRRYRYVDKLSALFGRA